MKTRLTSLPNITIKEALKKIDDNAQKILFIVDSNECLLGTLSDGDIRRQLLKGDSIENNIMFNENPKYIMDDDYSDEIAKNILIRNNYTIVPILSEGRKIKRFVSWEELFTGKKIAKRRMKKIKIPVVIMAGGKGIRLDPFTKVLPKPLIPIGNKPIIELIMNKFSEYGIKNFFITVNHKARMIKAYFEEFNAKFNITYIDEDEPLGTAGSLKFLQGKIVGHFFVSNSDIIIEADYSEILGYHKKHRNDITLVASVKQINIPYGICEMENGGTLKKLMEKPELNYLVNTGFYILNSNVLRYIPKRKFYHITHLIEEVKNNNGKIGVFPISEKSWTDIGEWELYKNALEKLKVD